MIGSGFRGHEILVLSEGGDEVCYIPRMDSNATFAKNFIERLNESLSRRCVWCRRDRQLSKRKILCYSCNQIRMDLTKARINVEAQQNVVELLPFSSPLHDLRIAEYMKESCIASGDLLDFILNGSFECTSLEGYFRDVADRIAKDEHIHYNLAGFLEELLTPEQIRAIGFLFWEIFSEEASHKRKQGALAKFGREHLTSKG
jgi:hypothetical protein